MCAGLTCAYDPETFACEGDAGGPFTMTITPPPQINDNSGGGGGTAGGSRLPAATVVAVISYGPKVCREVGTPGVYTRLERMRSGKRSIQLH